MFEKIREKLSKVAKNEEEEIVFKKLEEDELDLKSGVEHPVYEDEEDERIIPEPPKKSYIEGGNIELKV